MRIAPYIALVAAFMINTSPALAQAQRDFTLVNGTGYEIAELYVAPSASDDWEEDVLGRDVLSADHSVEIGFPKRGKTCIYDLKVVYSDAEEAEWERFDLCALSEITIRYNRKTGETWAEHDVP